MPMPFRMLRACALFAWLVLWTGSAQAVITYSDPGRNGLPSSDSIAYPAWQLQGQFGIYLATPIAPNYFITAHHIGGADGITFQGQTYSVTASQSIPESDLTIWTINGAFPTYAPLYTLSDEVGKPMVVIGRGAQRGDPVTVGTKVRGWLWGARDHVQSWGENDISSIVDGGSIGQLLAFDFNAGSRPNEGIVADQDSGGGVFIQDQGVWKLAGINYGVQGAFSRTGSKTDLFYAALFDTAGLYIPTDSAMQNWTRVSGPAPAYASRISSRASSIYSLVPGCPVVQQDYTVTVSANMGNIDVADTTTVGDGVNAVALRAFHLRAGNLIIDNAAQVIISSGGGANGTSTVAALSIAPAGQFDLADNCLIVQAADPTAASDALQQVTALLKTGYGDSANRWKGFGIASSAAAAKPATGLAVMLNDRGDHTPIYTTFNGIVVDANSILVKYTWNGDMNLDGIVNADDYFLIDAGYISHAGGYHNGDLNYDGAVNADDYFLIDSAFIAQAGPLSVGGQAMYIGSVPEPGAAMVISLAVASLTIRRSRAPL